MLTDEGPTIPTDTAILLDSDTKKQAAISLGIITTILLIGAIGLAAVGVPTEPLIVTLMAL